VLAARSSLIQRDIQCMSGGTRGRTDTRHHLKGAWWVFVVPAPPLVPQSSPSDGWLSVVTLANRSSGSIQQACFAHALGNLFGVRAILEWQPLDMILQ
jgi:hypothetical protein